MISAALYLNTGKPRNQMLLYITYSIFLWSVYTWSFSSLDMTEKILENDFRISECLR